MKINFKHVLKIIFLLCAISMIYAPIAHTTKNSITITYHDFWPLLKTEKNGTMSGIFYEIITEAMNRLNIKIKWESYPWSRCQRYVKAGIADGIMTIPTNERTTYSVTHPTPFYHKNTQLFTYKGNPQKSTMDRIKNLEDIKDANLTVITYLGDGWNKNHIEPLGITTYKATKIDKVWPMLIHKRGDVVIEWPLAAWIEINKQNLSKKIILTNGTIDSMPFHLLISKKSKYVEILPELDLIIQRMLKDGTIDGILRKYKQIIMKQN